MTRLKIIKQIIGLYSFIFIVWGLYRYLFRLPEEIEEVILKPLIWLVPIFWLIRKEKERLVLVGWTTKNLFKSLYLGIGLGIIFAFAGFLAHNLKYGGLNLVAVPSAAGGLLLVALAVSLVTAVCEETVFRGFIFSQLWQVMRNELAANVLSSLGWAVIHFPVAIFTLHYNFSQMMIYLILTFIFGAASSLVFARTGTITASVLLHVFWSWPINLFR